jgi:hypothetical protein
VVAVIAAVIADVIVAVIVASRDLARKASAGGGGYDLRNDDRG